MRAIAAGRARARYHQRGVAQLHGGSSASRRRRRPRRARRSRRSATPRARSACARERRRRRARRARRRRARPASRDEARRRLRAPARRRRGASCPRAARTRPGGRSRAGSSGLWPPTPGDQAAADDSAPAQAEPAGRARPGCRRHRRRVWRRSGSPAACGGRLKPRAASSSATAAPRAGWRGTMHQQRPLGRSAAARRRRATSASSPGMGARRRAAPAGRRARRRTRAPAPRRRPGSGSPDQLQVQPAVVAGAEARRGARRSRRPAA